MDFLNNCITMADQRSPQTNTACMCYIVKNRHEYTDDAHYDTIAGVLDALIQHGADVNHVDANGRHMLWYPIIDNKPRIAKYMLEKGAHITGIRKGQTWCAMWWPILMERRQVLDVFLDHVGTDVALEMGADPKYVCTRDCDKNGYERRFQIEQWRHISDETRRLKDTPINKRARTRSAARSTLQPSPYVAERVARFKPLPIVEVKHKAQRSIEGQVLGYMLTMPSELFKTLIDEGFALV